MITGITRQLDAVVWRKSGTDVTTLSGSNYVVTSGTYGSNSQTTTLTVKASANTADSTYTCVITSNEHQEVNKPTVVTLNVFCERISSLICLYQFTNLFTFSPFVSSHYRNLKEL